MNTAAAKQTIKQCFQTLADEQLQQYHLTHDYFSGRALAESQMPRLDETQVDVTAQKRQRYLNSLNEVLYPTPTLGSVLGDSLAALQPASSMLDDEQTATLEKPSEDLVNRSKRWFALYQADDDRALLTAQSSRLNDANLAVLKRGFSRNTILIQNACMLSEFWIRSPLDWDNDSDKTLLEHLFVAYQAPAFLKRCWYRVADESNIQWLLCFVLYAQGGSLKALATFFGWKVASHKLWHQLFSCPATMLPHEAVLYAEFKRMGGWAEDFACLMANDAYVIDLLNPPSEGDWEFWYDTCRWTISKQYDLHASQHSKVLSWARHQFTEFARQGDSYRLQGRSLNKVMESIAEYEQAQRQLELARARMAERARQVSMARIEERERLQEEYRLEQAVNLAGDYYDIDEPVFVSWKGRGWNWQTRAHGLQWHFVELTSTQELINEGNAMDHCVGGYSMSCVEGESVIVSLRCDGQRKATIEVDPLTKVLIQLQGKCNAAPKQSVQSLVSAWFQRIVLMSSNRR